MPKLTGAFDAAPLPLVPTHADDSSAIAQTHILNRVMESLLTNLGVRASASLVTGRLCFADGWRMVGALEEHSNEVGSRL